MTHTTSALPTQARVVVVGGGIAGCSVAYHLAQLGVRETVLLERRSLTCGTTWHAAGLLGQVRSTQNLTRLSRYGVELYGRLEAETGVATGFRCNGSVSVARTAERMTELRRLASMARCFGVEVAPIGPAEAGKLWPLMRTDDLVGAVHIPGDAQTNPGQTALALAAGARRGGVTILEDVVVTGMEVRHGRVSGVLTEGGRIACETVVNCGGLWAREIARTARVAVPLFAAEHMYMVAVPRAAIPPTLPVLRDADGHIYLREREGDLVMGGFEPVAKPRPVESIPTSFAFSLFDEDWAQFRVFIENAHLRVPCLVGAEVKQLLNGPESFTPDTRYLLGEAPGVTRLLRGGWLSLHRHRFGGGSGPRHRRVDRGGRADHGPVGGRSSPLRAVAQRDALSARARGGDGRVALRHALAVPADADGAGPPALAAARSSSRHAGPASGRSWDGSGRTGLPRLAWNPRIGTAGTARTGFPTPPRSTGPCGRRWDSSIRARLPSGSFDGPDAEAALQRLCANDVGGPPGSVRYTAMLNERGGIECDLTVTRLGRRPLLHRHRGRGGRARPRLDPAPPFRLGPRRSGRSHRRLRHPRTDGPAFTGAPIAPDRRRSLQRGFSVRDRAGDRGRRSIRTGAPHHVRGRARLGVVRPGRVRRFTSSRRSSPKGTS